MDGWMKMGAPHTMNVCLGKDEYVRALNTSPACGPCKVVIVVPNSEVMFPNSEVLFSDERKV